MENTDRGSTREFPFRRSGVGTRYSIYDNPGRIFMLLILGQTENKTYVNTIFGGSGEDCACVYVTVSIHKCMSVQEMESRALHTVDQLSTLELFPTSSVYLLCLFCLTAPFS